MKKRKDSKKLMVILVSIIIVSSMIISIFAIVVDNQNQNSLDYNKHSFTVLDNGYKTKINGTYMDFYYYPSDLERISLSPGILSKIRGAQALAFAFDPNVNVTDNLLYVDTFRYDIQTQMDKPVYFGITGKSDKYGSLPIVGCENATSYLPLILINIYADTGFNVSEEYPNCIIMNGKLKEILALKDRLVYGYYGIMS